MDLEAPYEFLFVVYISRILEGNPQKELLWSRWVPTMLRAHGVPGLSAKGSSIQMGSFLE